MSDPVGERGLTGGEGSRRGEGNWRGGGVSDRWRGEGVSRNRGGVRDLLRDLELDLPGGDPDLGRDLGSRLLISGAGAVGGGGH